MPKKRNFLGGMQNYNPKNGEYESRLTKADGTPATKENMPGGEDEKSKAFKKFGKDKKPTDYKGVEKTPYGYIYNVNGKSITDLKEERKSIGMKVDDSKNYGFSVFKNGEEVFYDTFEEAYNSVNATTPRNKQMDYKELGEYVKEGGLNKEKREKGSKAIYTNTFGESKEVEIVDVLEKHDGTTQYKVRYPDGGIFIRDEDELSDVKDSENVPLDRYGNPIDKDNLDLYEDADIYETDEYGFVLLPKKLKKGLAKEKYAMDLGEYISEDSMSAIERYAKHYDVDVDTIKDVIAEKIESGELTSENEERIVDDILEDVVTGKIS